ncbi:hypothetical protein HT576_16405 [Haloterrigena sp. SYSU A121-1]|uniref:Uncharacterized protein n=1 Tax=Haloterrigena gelatinilytica TaxID=2741724 RepID=A0A8J8KGJ0_9EURY|nr:hypothetical protein [Haloterrigena gelatinilytica]NUB92591.1 hypothetical protein [Haloterrigena gelatinilytica]
MIKDIPANIVYIGLFFSLKPDIIPERIASSAAIRRDIIIPDSGDITRISVRLPSIKYRTDSPSNNSSNPITIRLVLFVKRKLSRPKIALKNTIVIRAKKDALPMLV